MEILQCKGVPTKDLMTEITTELPRISLIVMELSNRYTEREDKQTLKRWSADLADISNGLGLLRQKRHD